MVYLVLEIASFPCLKAIIDINGQERKFKVEVIMKTRNCLRVSSWIS